MDQLYTQREMLLIEACERHIWEKDKTYAASPNGYTLVECNTLDDLIADFQHGNWADRNGFLYKNLAFVQMVDAGDEYLSLVFQDEQWAEFDTVSFERLLEEKGSAYVGEYIAELAEKYDSKLHIEKGGHPVDINVFITNLGKYNEGELAGEWLNLPTTKEEVQAVLQRIGIDGVQYEEVFFTDYESDIDGLQEAFGEYMSLDELNYLAQRIGELSSYEREAYAVIVGMGDYGSTLEEFINLTDSLDAFTVYDGIHDDEDLGRYYVEEAGIYDIESMGPLANYIDYGAFGRDVRMEEGGSFYGGNYVIGDYSGMSTDYKGTQDIPEEYKVFVYPPKEKEKKEEKKLSNRRKNNRDER